MHTDLSLIEPLHPERKEVTYYVELHCVRVHVCMCVYARVCMHVCATVRVRVRICLRVGTCVHYVCT